MLIVHRILLSFQLQKILKVKAYHYRKNPPQITPQANSAHSACVYMLPATILQALSKGKSQAVPKPSETVDKWILPGQAFLGPGRTGQGIEVSTEYNCQVPLKR